MIAKRWIFRQNDPEAERALVESGVPLLTARVLSARKVRKPEVARHALSRSFDRVPDPFLLHDMDRAVERLRRARENSEKCAVYGDYDVDGITSSCLVAERLETAGFDVTIRIPTRREEGYGVACNIIDELAAAGVTLIVTVDLGITAVEEVEYARTLGVDFIITDHHECPDRLPDACAVVNPLRPGSRYPFKGLAGVGVAFMLMLAFEGTDNLTDLADAVGDLYAIGTVADVMPMLGANRSLVSYGLARLDAVPRPGIRALVAEAFVAERHIDENTIGYSLAPRINAAGRMGSAADAVELLLTQDHRRAEELAAKLCELNRERQKIENDMFEEIAAEAERVVDEEGTEPRGRALVLASDRWHQGIVGIVASRLAETFARPVFLICLENGVGRGSGRSFYGMNILEIMKRVPWLFENWGGHEYAVGFTIREENIPAFRESVGEFSPTLTSAHLTIDAELRPREIEPELVSGLGELGPFGPGNPPPLFILRGVELSEVTEPGRGVRMKLNVGGRSFAAMHFTRDTRESDFGDGDFGDALVYVDPASISEGGEVRFILETMRMPPDEFGRYTRELELYARLREGERISASEAARLLPGKNEAVAVLRYLRASAGEDGTTRTQVSSFCRRVCKYEHIELCYGRLMVCVRALYEKGRLKYTRDGEAITIRLGERVPVDLNTAPTIVRLRELINQKEGGGECGKRDDD